MLLDSAVFDAALDELAIKSRKSLYQRDFAAWLSDVLGERMYDKMAEVSEDVLFGKKPRTLVKSANGTGKDLALATPILTTDGWSTMGDLREGQYVFDEEGKPTRITFKSEVMHNPCYRVTFDDGASFIAGEGHLWNTISLNKRSHIRGVSDWRDFWDAAETLETRDIAATVGTRARNHLIPLARPLQYPTAPLPLDPYTLGVSAGVLGNKHIPAPYFTASVDQRIALVRGLMDTDGHADKRGSTAVFGQSNELLVRDFEALLTGLGVRYSTTTKIPKGGKRTWNVAFRSWFDPFTVGERKSRIFQDSPTKQASRLTARTIVSVEPVPTVPTACISVEGERSLYLAGRNLVPTHNTHAAARWVLWWITAFPRDESLAIITAPTLTQVRMGVWSYLKETYGYVKTTADAEGRPMPWPGWITEQDEWRYSTPGGNRTLAIARVPGAHDAVSQFQGLRKTGGRNFIALDEAGGVSRDIYRAIDKLMTSGDSRMAGIGNPDNRGTPFHDRYIDERLMREYQLHTITAYETPNLTGEVVYPNDPEKERLLRAGLVSAKWVYDMERMLKAGGEIVYDEAADAYRNLTGAPDGAFKSMVLGQFPDEDDRTLYSATAIQAARELELPDEDVAAAPVILGVDLATTGADESVVMVNRGGKVRVFDGKVKYDDGGETRETSGVWAKEDELTAARRVHAIAKYLGASEVRVDAAGVGAGIATNLERLPELQVDKTYVVIRVSGGVRSADPDRWANLRSQNHDYLRELLLERRLDIDYDDVALRDQLRVTTYDTNKRGAIQVTPKKNLRTEMHGSPDRLDALIYAIVDSSALTNNPLSELKRGDIVRMSPWEMLQASREADGYPL